MATFERSTADIKAVYVRRLLPGGNQTYDRLPYNLVTYDDGTSGIEGISEPHLSDMTPRDAEGQHDTPEIFITDKPPYRGVNEID